MEWQLPATARSRREGDATQAEPVARARGPWAQFSTESAA